MSRKCEKCGAPSGYYPLCRNCWGKENSEIYYDELPTEGFDECVACGAKTTGYAFCRNCFKKYTEEEMLAILNEEDEDDDEDIDFSSDDKETICPLCGNPSKGKPLCLDCYHDVLDKEDEIDRNSRAYELREYYYNLKSNIYRMTNYNYIKGNCKKLIAIALVNKDSNRDESLSDRVIDDVIEILKKKKPDEKAPEAQPENPRDSQKAAIYRTDDGHVVKSNGEKEIDDILYHLGICHAYEKIVDEIPSSERTVKSDFYIPVTYTGGIYIEYWGMDSDDYQDNKTEKKALYEKYDIPLIDVEKRDTEDRALLTSRIKREYNELKAKIK